MPGKAKKQADSFTSGKRAQMDFLMQTYGAEKRMNSLLAENMDQLPKDYRVDLSKGMTKDNVDDYKDFAEAKARKSGYKIHYLGALLGANFNKIGRFGQKTISKSQDKQSLIGQMDQKKLKAPYIDPFEALAGKKALERAQAKKGQEADERGAVKKEDLYRELLDRSRINERLVAESDFEKENLDEDYKTAAYLEWLESTWYRNQRAASDPYAAFRTYDRADFEEKDLENMVVGDVERDQLPDMGAENAEMQANNQAFRDRAWEASEQFAMQYDSSKGFIADYEKREQEDPNEFEAVLAVNPPSEVYLDYQNQLTKEKPLSKKMMQPDYVKILDQNMKKTAAYKEIVSKGVADAKAIGKKYDPDLDPNIAILRAQLQAAFTDEQGHSFIRMVAKNNGRSYTSYSFGFWPLTYTPGLGGTTIGVVKNPDPETNFPSNIERRFSITYPNYLRAAAKIRGVVGSQRSYSFLGYNCTSFAADIAKEAGVSIKRGDSAQTMQTFRYRWASIESPYSLAKFVRQANEKKDLSKNVYEREHAQENNDELSRQLKKKVADMSFLEGNDKETVNALREMVGNELKRYQPNGNAKDLRITRGKGGRVVRNSVQSYFDINMRDSLLNTLLANPLFQGLQETFGNNKDQKQYAYEILDMMIRALGHEMDMIEEQVQQRFSKDYAGNYDTDYDHGSLLGDDLTRKRKIQLAIRRDLIMERLGCATCTEFFVKAVKNPETMAKAIMMLRNRKGDSDDDWGGTGSDLVRSSLISGNVEINRWSGSYRENLIDMIARNSYFIDYMASVNGDSYTGRSLEEQMFGEILAFVKTYAPDILLGEEDELKLDQPSDYEALMQMMEQYEEIKEKLKTDSVKDFVKNVCEKPVWMKYAVDLGVKLPELPESKFDAAGAARTLSQRFSYSAADTAIQNAQENFDEYILRPLYDCMNDVYRPKQFEDFADQISLDYEEVIDFVRYAAEYFLPARVMLEEFNNLDTTDSGYEKRQEVFFQDFFEKALPLPKSIREMIQPLGVGDKGLMLNSNFYAIQDILDDLIDALVRSGLAQQYMFTNKFNYAEYGD